MIAERGLEGICCCANSGFVWRLQASDVAYVTGTRDLHCEKRVGDIEHDGSISLQKGRVGEMGRVQ